MLNYCGKEIHHVFKTGEGVTFVLNSQDDGETWYVQVSDNSGTVVQHQNLTEALREAGMRLSRAGDDAAIAASLEPALRYLVHRLGPGERFGDIGGPLLALYHQLTGNHFTS